MVELLGGGHEHLRRPQEAGREGGGHRVVGLLGERRGGELGELVVGGFVAERAEREPDQHGAGDRQHRHRAFRHHRADPLRARAMIVRGGLGPVGPEQPHPQQAHDRRRERQGRQQHQRHTHDQPGRERAQRLQARDQQRRERGDDRGGRRGDHHADAADGGVQRPQRRLALGDVLAMAEQQEDHVVGAHPEHHDQQQRRELGAHLEVQPVGERRRDALRHLVNRADDDDRQHRDQRAAEHESEQRQDQHDRRDRDHDLGVFIRRRRIDADRGVPGQLATQARAGQEAVGLIAHTRYRPVGAGIAGLPVEDHLDELHLLVFREIRRRGRDRAHRRDVIAAQRAGERGRLGLIGGAQHGAVLCAEHDQTARLGERREVAVRLTPTPAPTGMSSAGTRSCCWRCRCSAWAPAPPRPRPGPPTWRSRAMGVRSPVR